MDSFLLPFKEKRGRGDGEGGMGEEVEGHSEKIPESRWLSSPPSLERESSQENRKQASPVCVIMICHRSLSACARLCQIVRMCAQHCVFS